MTTDKITTTLSSNSRVNARNAHTRTHAHTHTNIHTHTHIHTHTVSVIYLKFCLRLCKQKLNTLGEMNLEQELMLRKTSASHLSDSLYGFKTYEGNSWLLDLRCSPHARRPRHGRRQHHQAERCTAQGTEPPKPHCAVHTCYYCWWW